LSLHDSLYARWLDQPDPALRANALICLINQANYLLDRQIESLEKAFIAGAAAVNSWPPPASPSAAARKLRRIRPIGRIWRIGRI
jgi:hypothetical protein